MHPYRLTIFFAVVLIGLGVYFYFVEAPSSRQAQTIQTQQRQLIPFDDQAITELTVKTEKETIVLTRDPRFRWHIIQPVQAPADSREVGKILRALTIGKAMRVIQEEGSEPERYGLAFPRLSLTLVAGNQTEELALGDQGPFGASLYVRKKSDGQIVLTTLDPLTFFKKTLYTFRFKDILRFNRTRAHRLHLQYENEELLLEQRPGVHGISKNWRFLKPIEGPADRTKIGLLLMALEDLTADGFVDNQVEKDQLVERFDKAQATITIRTGDKDHVLRLYQLDAPKPQAYAVTSLEQPVYHVNPDVIRDLTKSLFDLRDPRLLGVEREDLAMISVKTPNEAFVLIHQSGEWVMEDTPTTPLKQQLVKLFVSRVVDYQAEIRISEEEKAESTFGLDNPTVTIIATDQKGRERGHLVLGHRQRGLVYAMGAGLPGIYQGRSMILTQIPSREQLMRQLE